MLSAPHHLATAALCCCIDALRCGNPHLAADATGRRCISSGMGSYMHLLMMLAACGSLAAPRGAGHPAVTNSRRALAQDSCSRAKAPHRCCCAAAGSAASRRRAPCCRRRRPPWGHCWRRCGIRRRPHACPRLCNLSCGAARRRLWRLWRARACALGCGGMGYVPNSNVPQTVLTYVEPTHMSRSSGAGGLCRLQQRLQAGAVAFRTGCVSLSLPQ